MTRAIPSLHFKKVGDFWSARVGDTLAIPDDVVAAWRLPPDEIESTLRKELALALYQRRVLPLAKAAALALASVVTITKQFGGSPYEWKLPRVPWLREQSYVNAQSVQPVEFSEFARKAPGKFDPADASPRNAAAVPTDAPMGQGENDSLSVQFPAWG